MAEIKPIVVIAVAGGAVLLYSGIRGKSVSSAFRNVLMGESPSLATNTNSILDLSGISSTSGTSGISAPTIPGRTQGNVTPKQVYQAFRAEGIPVKDAITLTAITGVESGYSTKAFNGNAGTGDYSIGLTQINYFGSLYPGRLKLIGMTPTQLLNGGLQAQARATALLYREDGLQPWMPDITSGKINAFMAQALAAAGQ